MGTNRIVAINEDDKKYSSAEDLEDMDEDQITNIFKDEGMMKKEPKDLEKEKRLEKLKMQGKLKSQR